jgi:hypothetical protein
MNLTCLIASTTVTRRLFAGPFPHSVVRIRIWLWLWDMQLLVIAAPSGCGLLRNFNMSPEERGML